MMKHELEQLTGRRFTEGQFNALELLYCETDLDKKEFARTARNLIKHMTEPPEPATPIEKVVAIMDPTGNVISMEGKILTCKAELWDADIKTGKSIFRMIPCSADFRDTTEIEMFSDDPKISWL